MWRTKCISEQKITKNNIIMKMESIKFEFSVGGFRYNSSIQRIFITYKNNWMEHCYEHCTAIKRGINKLPIHVNGHFFECPIWFILLPDELMKRYISINVQRGAIDFCEAGYTYICAWIMHIRTDRVPNLSVQGNIHKAFYWSTLAIQYFSTSLSHSAPAFRLMPYSL